MQLTGFQLVTYAITAFVVVLVSIHFIFKSTYTECSTCRRDQEIKLDVSAVPPPLDDGSESGWSSDDDDA
jgi:hypothetical protein